MSCQNGSEDGIRLFVEMECLPCEINSGFRIVYEHNVTKGRISFNVRTAVYPPTGDEPLSFVEFDILSAVSIAT